MQQACGPYEKRAAFGDLYPQIRDATQFHAMVRTAPMVDGTERKSLRGKGDTVQLPGGDDGDNVEKVLG